MYNPEIPTKIYTILPITELEPKIVETKLKSNAPTKPQFKPPIIKRIPATISSALSFISTPPFCCFYYGL